MIDKSDFLRLTGVTAYDYRVPKVSALSDRPFTRRQVTGMANMLDEAAGYPVGLRGRLHAMPPEILQEWVEWDVLREARAKGGKRGKKVAASAEASAAEEPEPPTRRMVTPSMPAPAPEPRRARKGKKAAQVSPTDSEYRDPSSVRGIGTGSVLWAVGRHDAPEVHPSNHVPSLRGAVVPPATRAELTLDAPVGHVDAADLLHAAGEHEHKGSHPSFEFDAATQAKHLHRAADLHDVIASKSRADGVSNKIGAYHASKAEELRQRAAKAAGAHGNLPTSHGVRSHRAVEAPAGVDTPRDSGGLPSRMPSAPVRQIDNFGSLSPRTSGGVTAALAATPEIPKNPVPDDLALTVGPKRQGAKNTVPWPPPMQRGTIPPGSRTPDTEVEPSGPRSGTRTARGTLRSPMPADQVRRRPDPSELVSLHSPDSAARSIPIPLTRVKAAPQPPLPRPSNLPKKSDISPRAYAVRPKGDDSPIVGNRHAATFRANNRSKRAYAVMDDPNSSHQERVRANKQAFTHHATAMYQHALAGDHESALHHLNQVIGHHMNHSFLTRPSAPAQVASPGDSSRWRRTSQSAGKWKDEAPSTPRTAPKAGLWSRIKAALGFN